MRVSIVSELTLIRRVSMRVFVAASCCICANNCEANDNGTQWTPRLLRDVDRWAGGRDDRSITVSDSGLRIDVPPGKTWRIAEANHIRLPDNVGHVRLRIAQLGGEATWFMRIYGPLRTGSPRRTVGVFQDETRTGVVVLVLDPRLLSGEHRPPLQIQLGVEGDPGDYVVFDSLEFLPARDRAGNPHSRPQPVQRTIECVELMPNLPRPFKMLNWCELA